MNKKMEGPGMSLFQGAASIHINNSAQDRLEEQEEIEDQKRRNEELKHKLANGFDDLLDDDEVSSVNSSGNFTMDAAKADTALQQNAARLPPTYIESLNYLKETHHNTESPKIFCETPRNQHSLHIQRQEATKLTYSPYEAGDGQNFCLHQEYRGHINGINNFEARQELMNNELKVMYEMRVKECQQLATQIEKMDSEIDSLRARLSAAINDRDKADLSLQEAHHLLASSKHKMIELEQQVTTVTEKLIENDQEKEQLKLELQSANISLQEVQQRLHTLQIAHSHDTDTLFREQQDRHREEMDRMQNDLMKAKTRLEEKDNEIKLLEKRCMEKDREKEEILIEKGGTINRLANELETAQNRLVGGETVRLKEKVSHLTTERNAAREQVKELGSKLEVTAHELVLCRNKLASNQKEYDNWRTTLHQILMESLPNNSVGDPSSPVKLATLKEILTRYKQQMQKISSLQEDITKRDKKLEQHRKEESELRSKLEEQRGKEMQLNSRVAVLQNKLELLSNSSDSELLDSYKLQNEQLQSEIQEVRMEYKALDLRYTELEMELEKLKSEKGSRASIVQEANTDLLRELERYSGQMKDILKENGELKTLYLQACSSREAISRELKDLQTKIQKERDLYKSQEKEYVERLDKEKRQMEKLNSELTVSREELERANKRILELQKEFTDKQKEFTEKLDQYLADGKSAMRKEMEPCSQCDKHLKHIRHLEEELSKCSIKLVNQESNETLMKELKGKAEFFHQYIVDRFRKLQEQRSVGTSTEDTEGGYDGFANRRLEPDGDDALDTKTILMMKEKAIRDQIAEKFTLEMKTMEMDCARRIKEIENQHLESFTKLKEVLERKVKEVDTLKEFILAERAKVTEILDSKENEISVLIKEHNELQAECQKCKDNIVEWRLKAERYKERFTRSSSAEDALRNERNEWKQKYATYAKEMQTLQTKMAELQAKITQVEQNYEKLQTEHQTVQDKYKNAKKTVYTYKDYISKKDTHVNNEMNRIQDEYRKVFLKLQNQINYYINCRVQEEKSKGKQMQAHQYQHYDYTEKLNQLNQDFARLTQSLLHGSPESSKK